MEDRWRLFVGCFVHHDGLASAYHHIIQLAQPFCRAKWVEPANLHFTLAFLGNLPCSLVSKLLKALSPLLHPHPSHLELTGLGVFPDWNAPRVLYVPVEDRNGQLSRVHCELHQILSDLGFAPEDHRPFTPHVTIARLKHVRSPKRLRMTLEPYLRYHFGQLTQFEPLLIRSILRPEGPLYSAVLPDIPITE
ncbi:MAG: RNA 2',3'-cyclic phosphodiesterase [Candidatus Kapabacteria bacterium]|nr:RNA 2',3'-cyclic phosphodiesterase [Candidatus Kapabacteria bacterium]MDW8011536.1 RNA 2',3'-cyclic phosphodiesterase [Bacteroidota bacterium]